MKETIRRLISEHAKLPVDVAKLSDSDDLYDHGMTSHASVMLMLGLENEFEVEFPDSMLTRDVFASVSAIADAVEGLRQRVA